MRESFDLLRELDKSYVRDVWDGAVTRDALQTKAEDLGYRKQHGKDLHRLVRAHENVNAFIAFYMEGERHVEDGETSKVVNGNYADIEVLYPHGAPILNDEELMRRCDIDVGEDWEVYHRRVNSWGGQAKVGMKGEESLVYTNHFKAAVRIRKKEFEPQFEVPKPVHVDLSDATLPDVEPLPETKPDGWKTALVLMDRQYGFARDERSGRLMPMHARPCIDLAVQVAQLVKPDKIIDVGDIIDFPAISSYLGPPNLRRMIEPATAEAAYDNERLMVAAETGDMTIIEGNHDERLDEKLQDAAPELWQIRDVEAIKDGGAPALSLRGLMCMDEKGIEWRDGYPDNDLRLNEGLVIEHGDVAKRRSGQTVYTILRDQTAEHSTVFGHIHRFELASFTNWIGRNRREFFAASLGCMCDLHGRVEGVKERQNWQWGFGLVHYDPDGWHHTLEPIRVHPPRDGKPADCYVRGRRLFAREPDLEALSAETNWNFMQGMNWDPAVAA